MKITKIELIPIKAQSGLVAFANLVFDEVFFVGSIGIHKKLHGTGYRLTFPTKKVGMVHISLFHPMTPALSKYIEEKITARAEELFDQIQ